jgi:cobalamin biosynthesis protein CbiG
MTPTEVKRLNSRYVREEQKRINALREAWARYAASARALGLHPLTYTEITDRERELKAMERRNDDPEWVARQIKVADMQERANAPNT